MADIQDVLRVFADEVGNIGQWYGWAKVDAHGNPIPNSQRMTLENLVLHDETAVRPSQGDYDRIAAVLDRRTEGSFREFMALFTEAEADAIYAAEASTAANGDFTLRKWFDRARGGATMRLDHADTIAGIGLLVTAGLLTQTRADAVLGSDFDDQ